MGSSLRWLVLVALSLAADFAAAQAAAPVDEAALKAELAKKLANPVASLISVPLQNNFDFGYGPAESMRYLLNVQPVIPFSVSEDWNLITRTIVPIISQASPVSGGEDYGGFGEILQSFFLSPKEPVGGWILAGGPVLGWNTASDERLGTEKWTLGPTVLALRQESGWTYGLLANHVWSIGGNDARPDVSATFLQPFLSYTTKTQTTFTMNTESTYDWENEQWTVPLNVAVAQLVKLGSQMVQFQFGPRVYLDKPDGGPEWGLRAALTLLFPK
jgi:hypothetical protein